MADREFDLLVIGEINPDLVLRGDVEPNFGQIEKIVEDAQLTIGSSGVIFACGASRLDLRVAFVGLVGDDLFGRFMLDAMEARQINTYGVRVDDSYQTGLSVVLSREDDRAILTYPGAIPAMRVNYVSTDLLQRAKHVHVSSYFLQDGLRPDLARLLAEARRHGCSTSLDTNWDPAGEWNGELSDVIASIDVFLPNEAEACAITGQADAAAAMEVLANRVETVAVKCGDEGAIAQRGKQTAFCDAFLVDVVDAIGAGDSFNAGFLYGLLRGLSLEETLRWGCACGGLSTRAPGGTEAQPTCKEVQAFLASNSL